MSGVAARMPTAAARGSLAPGAMTAMPRRAPARQTGALWLLHLAAVAERQPADGPRVGAPTRAAAGMPGRRGQPVRTAPRRAHRGAGRGHRRGGCWETAMDGMSPGGFRLRCGRGCGSGSGGGSGRGRGAGGGAGGSGHGLGGRSGCGGRGTGRPLRARKPAAAPPARAAPVPVAPAPAEWDRRVPRRRALRARGTDLLAPGNDSPPGRQTRLIEEALPADPPAGADRGRDDAPIIPLPNARLMHLLIPQSRLHVYRGGHLGLVTEAFLGQSISQAVSKTHSAPH